MDFHDLELEPEILEGISSMGFIKPTPIQEQTIPIILSDSDLIACAQTGTGKTAAYVLPLLQKIKHTHTGKINTLVIVPTRELALQIDQQIQGISYFTGTSSIPVYGGGDGNTWSQQKSALTNGVDMVIATPGRLIAHIQLGYVDFSDLRHLVLDEADRMLDMGFYDDIMQICKQLPARRQSLLFSATMPPKIRDLASKFLNNPKEISLKVSIPVDAVLQAAYMVYDQQKTPLISNLLTGKSLKSVIVFTSTKKNVDTIVISLKNKGLDCEGIHSDLEQERREEIMLGFKNRKFQILVATDIVSRGIDIEDIELIINYDVPHDPEDYIHRIGRTARAEAQGVALTFITEKDQNKFLRIENFLKSQIYKVPLPPILGDGPNYNPRERKGKSRDKKSKFKPGEKRKQKR